MPQLHRFLIICFRSVEVFVLLSRCSMHRVQGRNFLSRDKLFLLVGDFIPCHWMMNPISITMHAVGQCSRRGAGRVQTRYNEQQQLHTDVIVCDIIAEWYHPGNGKNCTKTCLTHDKHTQYDETHSLIKLHSSCFTATNVVTCVSWMVEDEHSFTLLCSEWLLGLHNNAFWKLMQKYFLLGTPNVYCYLYKLSF